MTTKLNRNVMRRVYLVYIMRKCCQKVSFELIGFIIVTGATLSLISVRNILNNMPSVFEPSHMARFGYSSLLNTEHYVQLLLVSGAIAGTVVFKNACRSFVKSDRFKNKKRERILA